MTIKLVQNVLFFCREYIEITASKAELVWRPRIIFRHLLKNEKAIPYGKSESFAFVCTRMPHNMMYYEEFQLTISCQFDFLKFPFDSHECRLEYGDTMHDTSQLQMNSSIINYAESKNTTVNNPGIVINDLPLPYEITVESIQTFDKICYTIYTCSYTGMLMKIKRTSFGQLRTGFFVPTASFALLSMISFLIKPDVVRPNTYSINSQQ